MSNNVMSVVRTSASMLANLAETQTGGGSSGETYLRVDKDNGDLTFGQDRAPLPATHRFAVGLHTFEHGYSVTVGGKLAERHMVPMAVNPVKPIPPGGKYVPYEQDGPRDAVEIKLDSVTEPGFNLVFTSWSASHTNRLRKLLGEAINHAKTDEGQEGFLHPVILVKSGHYFSPKKRGEVYHFDYQLVDWLKDDGKTLLSTVGNVKQVTAAPDALSELEAELMKA